MNAAAPDRVAQDIREQGEAAEAGSVDVRNGAAINWALETVRERRGRLDIAVSTPGVNVRKPLLKYSEDEFERVVAINLQGSFNVLCAPGRS